MDFQDAKRIAEEYVSGLVSSAENPITLLLTNTLERDFGWVFFCGPSDPSIAVAGNAPLIVDREDGSVHVTGTAYPIERYLESYSQVKRAYPFAVPEYVVSLEGWEPGMRKVSLTKLIRASAGKGLAEAKRSTDEVLAGELVTLTVETVKAAEQFCAEASNLGVIAKWKTRFR